MTAPQSTKIRSIEDLHSPAGRLEALLNAGSPNAPYSALVCHPHPAGGGTLHNKVVYHAMKTLNALGLPVLRFNFRGVGRSEGSHDDGTGERDDVRAAVDWLDRAFHKPVLVAGFSFGASVSLHACCSDPRVPGIIALGLPVQAAGRSYTYRVLHTCNKPKLFVSGDHDQYAPAEQIQAVLAEASQPRRLVFIGGAEHFFQGTPASPEPKLDRMQAAMRLWLADTFALQAATGEL